MWPYDLNNPPTDVATINVGGKSVNFIVRMERGTINRFLYSIALLTPNPDPAHPTNVDFSAWNKDLIFTLQGATGTGHAQGSGGGSWSGINNPGGSSTMMPDLLAQGYAVAFSSGTATSTSYNLILSGQTAAMVKQQFVAAYAQPRFTFAVGASGGAVQQMVYAQNLPGLLDGAIPVQNFSDMITQFNPVGDCELMAYYFDVVDKQVNGSTPPSVDPLWADWSTRSLITGFSGNDNYKTLTGKNPSNLILPGTSTAGAAHSGGSDVCMQQWRGAIPQFSDPYWGQLVAYGNTNIPKGAIATTFWGFANDLINVLTGSPTAKEVANPPNVFDNEGVQYGLNALKAGQITPTQFLNINAHVGGWNRPENFLPEGFPYLGNGSNTGDWDPWSAREASAMNHLSPTDIAPRTVANATDMAAIQNAYKSGLVYRGANVNIPMIHIEPYLEPTLDEHATKEPFVARQRLIAAKGNADNQAIWMINTNNQGQNWTNTAPFVFQALQAETNWLLAGSRPASVQDACYDGSNNLIAAGAHVWDGQVSADGTQVLADTVNGGACTKLYPIASNSRIAAGGPVSSSIFKCALKPTAAALHDGTYGNVFMSVAQEQRLLQIFSSGVCDYSKPDQALPPGM